MWSIGEVGGDCGVVRLMGLVPSSLQQTFRMNLRGNLDETWFPECTLPGEWIQPAPQTDKQGTFSIRQSWYKGYTNRRPPSVRRWTPLWRGFECWGHSFYWTWTIDPSLNLTKMFCDAWTPAGLKPLHPEGLWESFQCQCDTKRYTVHPFSGSLFQLFLWMSTIQHVALVTLVIFADAHLEMFFFFFFLEYLMLELRKNENWVSVISGLPATISMNNNWTNVKLHPSGSESYMLIKKQ